MRDGIFGIRKMIPQGMDVITVVHQLPEAKNADQYAAVYEELKSAGVVIITQLHSGLSASRNAGIQATNADYMLLADDDVQFVPDLRKILVSATEQHPSADILTMCIATPEGQPFKQYPAQAYRHTLRSVAKVSSIEIIIRRAWWIQKQLRFDERFGLGSLFPTGEEFIFLRDAMRAGAHIQYYPATIVVHPMMSSGKKMDIPQLHNKGAMITRVYGWRSWVITLAFAIRKRKEFKEHAGVLGAWHHMIGGRRHFLEHA